MSLPATAHPLSSPSSAPSLIRSASSLGLASVPPSLCLSPVFLSCDPSCKTQLCTYIYTSISSHLVDCELLEDRVYVYHEAASRMPDTQQNILCIEFLFKCSEAKKIRVMDSLLLKFFPIVLGKIHDLQLIWKFHKLRVNNSKLNVIFYCSLNVNRRLPVLR